MLLPSDYANFISVVKYSLTKLIRKDILPHFSEEQFKIMLWVPPDGMHKHFLIHELNSKGLHLLRALLARRWADRSREIYGWRNHSLFHKFMKDGYLEVTLKNYKPGV